MLRRGNNEGSIRQRPGGKWEATVQLNGHRFWLRTTTQAEARRGVADLRKQHEIGTLVPPSKVTVAHHIESWLAVASPDLRPKTRLDYDYMNRTFIGPAFGQVRVQRLTAPMIARQFAEWRTQERASGKTLLNVFRMLHRAMVVAHQWGLTSGNPLDGVEAPRAARPEVSVWSQGEASAFLRVLKAATWDTVLSVMLMATGARFGEVLAARWEDLDRATGALSICRNVVTIHGVYIEGDPKTRAGIRTVELPPFAVGALKAWRVVQLEERLAAGGLWQDTGRIVTLPDGATPKHRKAYNAFHTLCDAAGVPRVRMHDMRHLHASLLLASGLPLPTVSARLGHASTAVTAAIYSHALKGQDSLAAQAMERALAGG